MIDMAIMVGMNDAANENEAFYPGDGATYTIGSDRYPVTVRRVSKTRIETTDDRVAGSGVYVPCEQGERMVFTLKGNGRWTRKGMRCGFLTRGRDSYQDPSF